MIEDAILKLNKTLDSLIEYLKLFPRVTAMPISNNTDADCEILDEKLLPDETLSEELASKDDVKSVLINLKNSDHVMHLLAQFNAEKVSQLKIEDYSKIIKESKKPFSKELS